MPRECYDPETREWLAPEEYAFRKAIRRSQGHNHCSAHPMPYVMGDLPEYISPVTGLTVSGRRQRRYDLESSNCREVDPSEWKGRNGTKFLRPDWARRRGYKVKES